MLCYDGRLSLIVFLVISVPILGLIVLDKSVHDYCQWRTSVLLVPLAHYIIVNVLLRLVYKGNPYQIALRTALLSLVFAYGIVFYIYGMYVMRRFGMYMSVLSFFHYTEFLFMAIIQPKLVSVRSFVINHSWQYTIAAVASWVEFFIEAYYFPLLKVDAYLSHIGLLFCVTGEIMRKSAMITAGSNFNHVVQTEKADDHILITTGIYSFFRHPSYVGWFYWSIGTQFILLNPFCTVAYTLLSWQFFSERILIEEMMLLNFFGEQYYQYQQKVGTGLPFIKGYQI